MGDVADGTAAPGTVTIGGKAWTLAPLTYRDIGEYERWAEETYLARVERTVVNLSPEDAAERRKEAARVASQLSINPTGRVAALAYAFASAARAEMVDKDGKPTVGDGEFALALIQVTGTMRDDFAKLLGGDDPDMIMDELTRSAEGTARLFWQSIKKHHGDTSVEDVGDLLALPMDQDRANSAFARLNRGVDAEGEGGPEQGKGEAVSQPETSDTRNSAGSSPADTDGPPQP